LRGQTLRGLAETVSHTVVLTREQEMGQEAILVRELRREDDLAAVIRLCRDFFAEYGGHHQEFFDTDNLKDADISGRFLKSMESDDSATIIALIDDVIVGYAYVALKDQPGFYKVKRIGAISGLMVAKEHRRKGVATRLLAEARAFFVGNGIKYFTVFTAVANQAAIKFYERNGMTPLHTTLIGETKSS
jgi:ribosomal protein S18 acetylase RimI-like enzyme